MLEIHDGLRSPTKHFGAFQVSLGSVLSNQPDWLNEEIRARHGWRSFQRADAVGEALRIVHGTPIWEAVASKLGKPAAGIKKKLDLIIDRRNKIAHEADLDPTLPASKWPIDEMLAEDSISFIEILGHEIIAVVI
jgi:hypothetical protein